MAVHEAEPKIVRIEVDTKSRNMTYTPSVLHATGDDRVQWLCASGNFTLAFADDTPFDKVQIRGSRRAHSRGEHIYTAEERIKDDAHGVYPYSVAVAVDGEVFLDAHCPIIIIQ